MRSLFVFRDNLEALEFDSNSTISDEYIASITRDVGLMQLYVLTNAGHLYCYDISEDGYISHSQGKPLDLNTVCNNNDDGNSSNEYNDWFSVSTISETSLIVCISHSGYIVSIKNNHTASIDSKYEIEQEGLVDGGIATAMWSPDQTSLILVTNNNTLLSMTSSWDVINEIQYEPRILNSKCSLSWRSDGEYCCFISTDAEDSITRLRIHNKYLEIISVGRNIADGPASTLKGLSPCVAYGSSGALIAVAQQRVRQKYQIALMELNGLKHGEFDLRLPTLPSVEWEIVSLHWDISSTVIAVGAMAISADKENNQSLGVIQLYTRCNYYWYLKQQFSGTKLKCLGFDNEVVGRIYLSQLTPNSILEKNNTEEFLSAVRIVDYTWDTYTSNSRDCSVGVIDGTQVLLTPLGQCVIPPPMSKYRLSVPSQALHASFCSSKYKMSWDLLVLCDNYTMRLFYGEADGSSSSSSDISLIKVMKDFHLCMNHEAFLFRSCIAIEHSRDTIVMVILGSRNSMISRKDKPSTDELLIVHFQRDDNKVVHARFECITFGHVIRLTNWGDDNESIGIGVSPFEDESNFMLIRMSIAETKTGVNTYPDDVLMLPEICTHFKIISGPDSRVLAIGLSSRYRLFCGEKLLVVGANSFNINHSLDTLLYVTVGTKPFLHFMSLSSLFALDPLEGVDVLVSDSAEARPIERGARLVASVPDDAKVIIQLPRGNLETFEPRPLSLMQARFLLENKNFLDCLILLRKQRIDLNLMLDHNPQLFIENIDQLVLGALNKNPELLSLLISSLLSDDVCTFKYRIPQSFIRKTEYAAPSGFSGDDKINRACFYIREALLPVLSSGNLLALNPCLCTYAKQNPPLILDALQLIRDVCCQGSTLFSSKVQAAIRYLSFLQDGKVLFDAALSVCDFEMAKAVARQCQMDPKSYLPLLESFENIGRGYNTDTFQYALMHYAVNIHLKNNEKSIDWGLKAMESYYNATYSSSNSSESSEISELTKKLIDIVNKNNLYEYAVPRLTRLSFTTTSDNFIISTLNAMRKDFGEKSVKNLNYQEAVAAYLSMKPVCATEAIRATRLGGFWQQALAIAGRYSNSIGIEYSPNRIAQEIVEEYKDRLEQGESAGLFGGDEGHFQSSVFFASKDKEKSIQIANICIEYCNDVESAISILTMSRLWVNAANIAIKKDRNDLLMEEIGPMVRHECKEIIKQLKYMQERSIEIVGKLSSLWANPKERLEKVASTEPTLVVELRSMQGQHDYDDTKSEYSLQSNQTGASNVSFRSHLSNKSGTSSVSILSNLSVNSTTSKHSTTSSFTIEGLEHGLLSRGNIGNVVKTKAKQQKISKKAEKRRGRGENGRDVWGLQNESSMCEELWNYAQIRSLVESVIQVSDVLLLLASSSQDFELISQLQAAVDSYTNILMENAPPIAPDYPPDWLETRLMTHVKYFQDKSITNEIDNTDNLIDEKLISNNSSKTWWEVAADGIKYWRTVRKITFSRC